MEKDKSPTSIILSKMIGLIVFVILLILANILVLSIPIQIYKDVLEFINFNIIFFLGLLLIDLINEIFWNFKFPFILLAPITGSVLSVFIVDLLYRLWNFIDLHIKLGVPVPIMIIYALVGLITLISGYVHIIPRLLDKNGEIPGVKKIGKLIQKKEQLNWTDVNQKLITLGNNLEKIAKEILYNLVDALNKHIEINNHRGKKK